MNKFIGKGNISRAIDLDYLANNGLAIAKFSVALPKVKKEDGSDFINCVAFGKTAETIANNLGKGEPILIEGHIQTGKYENKEGKTIYTTDIVVDRFEFCGRKKTQDVIFDEGITPVEGYEGTPF